MTRVFTVVVISAVISAPFSLFVQYLITNILSAPSEHSAVVLPRTRSSQSVVPHQSSEVNGGTVSSDFKNLLDELSKYCEEIATLSTRSLPDSSSLEEFKSSWGMMSDMRVPHQCSTSSSFISCFGAQNSPESTAQHNLFTELSIVRKEVSREYEWFKEGAEKLFVDKGVCEEAKRRRLMYLFMKDLTSGVSGEILSNKSQRDSMSSSPSRLRTMQCVPLRWKAMAWIFVILMNMGLLLYVYLFAMTQTQSRQSAWFRSFIMWFLFDVFVSSTGVVLVTHLLIPLYVMSDIREEGVGRHQSLPRETKAKHFATIPKYF